MLSFVGVFSKRSFRGRFLCLQRMLAENVLKALRESRSVASERYKNPSLPSRIEEYYRGLSPVVPSDKLLKNLSNLLGAMAYQARTHKDEVLVALMSVIRSKDFVVVVGQLVDLFNKDEFDVFDYKCLHLALFIVACWLGFDEIAAPKFSVGDSQDQIEKQIQGNLTIFRRRLDKRKEDRMTCEADHSYW